jgi:hypothetical protein
MLFRIVGSKKNHTTPQPISEDSILHSHLWENLRCYINYEFASFRMTNC